MITIIAAFLFSTALQDAPRTEPKSEPKQESKPAADKNKDGLPLSLSYKDGIWIKADDGNFQTAINGRVITNYRDIFDRPNDLPAPAGSSSRTQPDSFYLRQARIDFNGTFYKQFDFRLQLDFPTGTVSNTGTAAAANTGTVQDAFLAWRAAPEFGLRIGQYKEPLSQEQTTSLRATDFVERSILDRLIPGRDIGLSAFGKPFNGFLEYEGGVFNGNGRAVVDNNDEKDVAGRLRISPFKSSEDGSFLKGLRLGVSGSYGDVDRASIDALDYTSTELGVKFLDVAAGGGAALDGRRGRIAAEFSWLWKSFGLRSEWARRTDHVTSTTTSERAITYSAWYVAATWLLTGETKSLEDRIVPATSFFEPGGWGAVELAVRYAGVHIDDDVFQINAATTSAVNADSARVLTVGVNWHLTRNVRISPNFIWEKYDSDIAFNTGAAPRLEDDFKGVQIRFQIDF